MADRERPTQPGARRMRAVGTGGLLALVAAIAGCPPQPVCIEPRDEREALARVNDNLTKIDRPLQYKALVSFRFRDKDDRDRQFIGHEANLLFAPPQDLLFDIRSLAGVVAQFGSNQERYWLWVEPETHKLWWGRWATLERGAPKTLPIPPDDLLDVLLLRPLPASLAGGLHPLLRKVGRDYRLLFVRLNDEGQPSGWREIRLDPCEPYQPLEIVDRLPDGRVQMHALLGTYRRIGETGPLTPRHYVVFWPIDKAELRLDVTKAVFRPDLPTDVFEFPSEWPGAVEQLDEDMSGSEWEATWEAGLRP